MVLTAGLPLYFLKALDQYFQEQFDTSLLSSYSVLVAPRLFLAVLSFFNDYCLWNLCRKFGVPVQSTLLLNAFSYVVLVYQTRTLSNTTECLLFNSLLMLATTTVEISDRGKNSASTKVRHKPLQEKIPDIWTDVIMCGMCVGSVVACGFFNRPTFIFFALVPVLFWLLSNLSSLVLAAKVVYFFIGAIVTATCLVLLDTMYYKEDLIHLQADIRECLLGSDSLVGCLFEAAREHLVFVPWNFILYNTSPENLALHVTHPRFLHFLVNIPILFGPLAAVGLIHCTQTIFNNPKTFLKWKENCSGLFSLICYVPIALLSIFPHQEPRFLLPIAVPLLLISSTALKNRRCMERFVTFIWIVFNIFAVIFFGFVHQGGVVPCIASLQSEIQTNFTSLENVSPASVDKRVVQTHIVFFHTYIPPKHLLLLRKHETSSPPETNIGSSVMIHDLQGAEDHDLKALLQNLRSGKENRNTRTSEIFVVMPFSRIFRNCQDFRLSWHNSFFPHLSMEDPPDLFRIIGHDGWTETDKCLPAGDRFSHAFRLRNLFSLVLLKLSN